MDKRRFIQQLPEVHNTETLRKFFGATVDQVFQPGRSEQLSGYIGSKPPYFDAEKDFYITEPSASRLAYQLEPAMVSETDTGEISNILTYDDLMAYLRAENAITNDHGRMFGDQFYGWVPPVDLDKLENYRQYYWFGDAPNLLPPVVLRVGHTEYDGDGTTHVFAMPPRIGDTDVSRETPAAFVDGLPVEIEVVGDTVALVETPAPTTKIHVFRYADLTAVLEDLTAFDPRPFNRDLTMTNLSANMRVRFEDGIAFFQGFGRLPYETIFVKIPRLCKTRFDVPWDEYTRPSDFFVEGVGSRIVVVPYPDRMTYKTTTPTYSCIDRRSRERGPWTVNNFWVHESAFRWTEANFPTRRAQRPIVEILPNLEIMNYGTSRLENITATLTGDPLYVPVVLDRPNANIGISDWDVFPFDTEAYESNGLRPLALIKANGKKVGQIFVDGGRMVNFGDRILVLQNAFPDLDGAIIRVRLGTTSELVTIPGSPQQLQTQNVLVLLPEPGVVAGVTVRLDKGRDLPWDRPGGTESWFVRNQGSDVLPWEYLSEAIEYYYDGSAWNEAQAPHGNQLDPLFALYTDEKVRHDRVPGSGFFGNRLFGYTPATALTGRVDRLLNRYVVFDGVTNAPIFQNDQSVVRTTVGSTEIPGFQYFREIGGPGEDDRYGNSWYPTGERTTQTLANGLFSTPLNLLANPDHDEVSTISRNQWLDNFTNTFVRQTGFEGSPYNYNNWRDSTRTLGLGYTGAAWQMGADYEVGDTCTRLLKTYRCNTAHMASVTFDPSKWTQRPIHQIIQNKSPLLRTMLLASDRRFDYLDAARFLDAEYARFRNKFRAQTIEVRRTGQRTEADDNDLWVETVLTNLRLTKTNEFPFSLSSMAGGQYFIPPTAAQMGMLNVYEPGYEYDDTYSPAALLLRGHDGSRTPVSGSFEDDILLALERRIYAAILPQFKTEAKRPFDFASILDGRSRGDGKGDGNTSGDPNPCDNDPSAEETGKTTYSLAEFVRVGTPIFLRWAQLNSIDYRSHNDFIPLDPFTWNYRDHPDRDGTKMPGNWRAIYRYYYDTDRPHACPWEMLGFGQKPAWWDRQYGAAPYTSGNIALWEDLRDGRIRQGIREGIDPLFVRPDLLSLLPVDEDGKLLNPMQIPVFLTPPTIDDAAREWVFGDGGPGEQVWINSASYPFAKSQIGYLLRPAEWVETTWDTQYFGYADDGQVINQRTHDRTRARDNIVHGEIQDAFLQTRYAILGIQQWISDLMASRSQLPSLLGDAMRRMRVQLIHKMAGFTKAENLRVFADNFGIVPAEDVSVILHNSPPIREAVYSGVIIEWTGNGYKVVGYDTVKEGFCIDKGDETSQSITISLGDAPEIYEWRPNVYYPVNTLVDYRGSTFRSILAHTAGLTFDHEFWTPEPQATMKYPKVTVYSHGQGTLTYVPYSTVFKTIQEVASFLWDYGRALEEDGFVFDYIDPKTGDVQNWDAMIRNFLAWAQMDWQPGNFIALSPGASQLKFITQHGVVYNVEETANGIYGLLNRTGRPIPKRATFVSRLDEETKVITTTNDLYCARLRVGEIEHIVMFSNRTIFNDIIYQPLLTLRQPRLRLFGLRTRDWTGRLDAPGYMVEQDTIEPNFWRAAENLRTMFDVEGSEDKTLRDYSRHLIGYQKRPYLDNLLVSETEQFEFFQGAIKQKGAPGVFDKLTRSQIVDQQSDLAFLEEWAFNIGRFGATESSHRAAFIMTRTDMRSNPQVIQFGTDDPYDAVLGITDGSSRWIEKPADSTNVFPYRADLPDVDGSASPVTRPNARALKTAGPVQLDEITYSISYPFRITQLFTALKNEGKQINNADRVWVYDMNETNRSYDVLRADVLGGIDAVNSVPLVQVLTGGDSGDDNESSVVQGTTLLVFLNDHGLNAADAGRLLLVPTAVGGDTDIEGFHVIASIPDRYSVVIYADVQPNADSRQPYCFVMRSVHFKTIAERNAFAGQYGFHVDDLAYVDSVPGFPGWVVFRWTGSTFAIHRQEPRKIDTNRIRNTLVYSLTTELTESSLLAAPLKLDGITVIDPISGNICGEGEREISFRVDYDPAEYTQPNALWGAENVGKLWWDTGTSVFLECETDIVDSGDPDRTQRQIDHRRLTWGRIAPGCSVDIWEWTRAYVLPQEYQTINPTSQIGNAYNLFTEYDQLLDKVVSVYYFWVRNPSEIPQVEGRSISAAQVALLISDPRGSDVPWVAPIAPDVMMIGNIEEFLNDTATVVQFELTDTLDEGVRHEQVALVRKNDPDSLPPKALYTLLRNSLTAFDDFVRPVPQDGLNRFDTTGATRRERRTMIANGRDGMLAGRRSFVTKLNEIMARRPLLVEQPDAINYLDTGTPLYPKLVWNQPQGQDWIDAPPRGTYDFVVEGLDARRALLGTDDYLRAIGFQGFDTFKYDTTGWDYDFTTTMADLRGTRLPRILMTNYTSDTPSWSIWEAEASVQPAVVKKVYTDTTDVAINHTPVARADTYSLLAGASWLIKAPTILSNDADSDNDVLTVTGVGPAPDGTGQITQISATTWLFQSSAAASGQVLIPYTITDGKGGLAAANVVFNIEQPEVIAAVPNSYTAGVNSPIVITLRDLLSNDVGSDISVISATQPVNGGVIEVFAGSIIYHPPVGTNATIDFFTYTIRSAKSGRTSTAQVTIDIEVSPIQAADDSIFVNYASSTLVPRSKLLENDIGVDIDVTSVSTATYGAPILENAGVRYTAPVIKASDNPASDSFPYTITDIYGQTSDAKVNVYFIKPPIVAKDDAVTSNFGTTLSIPLNQFLANDQGNFLTLTAVSVPTYGVAKLKPNGVDYQSPAFNPGGVNPYQDTFNYTITDAFGQTASAVMKVVFNKPPGILANDDTATCAYGSTVTIPFAKLLLNDVGQGRQVTGFGRPDSGTIVVQASAVVYTPPAIKPSNNPLQDIFTYSIKDAYGQTATARVIVTLTKTPIQANDDYFTMSRAVKTTTLVANPDTIFVPSGVQTSWKGIRSDVLVDSHTPLTSLGFKDGDTFFAGGPFTVLGDLTIIDNITGRINAQNNGYFAYLMDDLTGLPITESHMQGYLTLVRDPALTDDEIAALPTNLFGAKYQATYFDPNHPLEQECPASTFLDNDIGVDSTVRITSITQPSANTARLDVAAQTVYVVRPAPSSHSRADDLFTYTITNGSGQTSTADITIKFIDLPGDGPTQM